MGPFPLSPVCNPYYKLFSANNKSNSDKLDVGTFCPNQYKPCVFLAYHLGQTRNNTNSLIGVYSKQRQRCRRRSERLGKWPSWPPGRAPTGTWSPSRTHARPFSGGQRLKMNLTGGAHMSASGGREKQQREERRCHAGGLRGMPHQQKWQKIRSITVYNDKCVDVHVKMVNERVSSVRTTKS